MRCSPRSRVARVSTAQQVAPRSGNSVAAQIAAIIQGSNADPSTVVNTLHELLSGGNPSKRSAIRRSLPPLDPLRRYSVDEACAYLDVCKANLYARMSKGLIASFYEGDRRFIAGQEIARLSRGPSDGL